MKLQVKVIPSSSEDCIVGWLDDMLKIKVKAQPNKGKANKSVIKVIEKSLTLQKGSVSILSGLSTAKKIISITGYYDWEITDKLAIAAKRNT